MVVRKAEVKSFDSGSYTATIRLAESLSVWLAGVPVARNIAATEMQAGRSCAVIFFDDGNPMDAVVVAVYS